MFNIKNCLILLCIITTQSLFADPGQHLYPAIKKVNENFYVGKIAGRPLWLVAERLDDNNKSSWRSYIDVQNNGRVVNFINAAFIKGFTSDGSSHFKRVLNEVNLSNNEVWIVYVTKNGNPRPISAYDLSDYNAERIDVPHKFAKDVAMYVTVTTSPKALITSHMGVSASYEGAKDKIRGISPDLHSFAAKVMLMRNPDRKYMVNAPNMAMEEIIAKNLPEKSVFVGTREMKAELEKRDISRNQFRTENQAKIDAELAESPAKKTPEEEADRVRGVVSSLYNRYTEPYGYVEVNGYPTLLSWMGKYGPPLLSSDGVKVFKNFFTLYDKENPQKEWLSVRKDKEIAKDYNWMFSGPFSAAGSTHYIVVDLKNLADKGKVE